MLPFPRWIASAPEAAEYRQAFNALAELAPILRALLHPVLRRHAELQYARATISKRALVHVDPAPPPAH